MSCGLSNITWLCFRLSFLISVITGLEWLQHPADISIARGGDARFNCSVKDRGNNLVTWTKDGQTLFVNDQKFTSDAQYSIIGEFNLIISNVDISNEAVYTCSVQNLGARSASLTVLIPPGSPSLSINDTRSSFVEGDVISLTCHTEGGNPAPTIKWSKNNELLPSTASINTLVPRGRSSSQLTITLDRSDHQAQYTCVVFNTLNQDRPLTITKGLQVQYSPSISFGDYSPLVLLRDSSASLHCNIDANPRVSTVSWTKNGVSVSNINPTWTFSSVSVSDEGVYKCTAFNMINGDRRETSKSINVSVIYKPNIAVPQTYSVNEFATAVVYCNVTANPEAFEVKWERPEITMAAGHVLRINNIQRSHQGDYTCIAQNRLKPSGQSEQIGITRKTTTIFVQYKPGNAFIQPTSPVLVGQQIQLKCILNQQDQGFPAPTYEWKKLDTNTVLSTTTSTLTIASASLSDNGNYSCTPKNTMGSGGSSVILVEVYEKPVLIDKPSDSNTIPNTRTGYSLQCIARGRPPPSIKWFKDNQPLDQFTNLYTVNKTVAAGSSYSFVTTSQVVLNGPGRPQQLLMLDDIGNYTCSATSSADTVSKPLSHTHELFILFPPKTTTTEKVATSFGHTTELLCTAEAYPIPTFKWYKTTVPITAGGRYLIGNTQIISVSKATSILRITNVRADDLGEYNCRAENAYGRTTKTIMLVVKSRPEAPNNISMISKTWESVYLRWISGFDGGETQLFYIHFISIPFNAHGAWNVSVIPPQGLKFNVTRLMPYTTYEFRVYAENALGAGEKSEPITIRTNPLEFPSISYVPKYKVEDRSLHLSVNVNDSYCVRIKVSKDGGRNWKTVVIENADCFDVKSQMLTIPEDGVDKLNISLCLLDRQDVCGSHMSAQIEQQATADLTEGQVIIIGCVCAAILIILLIILVVVICRRRRLSKDYGSPSQANHRPQNVNGIPAANAKRGFDNQGMDTLDSLDHRAQRTPHGSMPEPYTQIPHNIKHTANSVQADRNGYTGSPGMTRPNGNIPQLDTSYDSQLEKHLFENEMNRINAANMRGNTYYDSKTEEISFNGTPRKDPQQYIDLSHDDHKGDLGPESGYSTAETSKPKKIKPKHRHHDNSFYYDDFVPFAHDPPGHTCGLPCCNSDLHIHLKVGRSHGGCMSVPMQHDIPADNFTLQRGHLGLFKGQSQLQNRPGYKSGFYSVQPVRGNAPAPRTLPNFGSVRGKTLPSALSGTTPLTGQIHFLRGREITLPKIARHNPAAFKRSAPFILADASVGETADTDSDMSSDSDLDYYMLSDFKTHVQVTNGDNKHFESNIGDNPVNQGLIYPWKMLEETKNQKFKSGSLSESSTYYDVIEDLKNDLKNYSWPRENHQWPRDDQSKVDERSKQYISETRPLENQNKTEIKYEEEEKVQSPKYRTFNFESNLFTPDRRHTLDTSMRYNPPAFDERKHRSHDAKHRSHDKKKHKKRRRQKPPKPKVKPTFAYAHELSDSYKSRSLPPVFPTIENSQVEEARSRLRKVPVPENKTRTSIPKPQASMPFGIQTPLSHEAQVAASNDTRKPETQKPMTLPKKIQAAMSNEAPTSMSHQTKTPMPTPQETQKPMVMHYSQRPLPQVIQTPIQQSTWLPMKQELERLNLEISRSQCDIDSRYNFNENDNATKLRQTDVSDIDKSRSLPPNTTFGYVNKGFVAEPDDKSIETLKRLVHDFKSQSLPPMFRPIGFEAARVARSRLNSVDSNNDDSVFYTQRLETVEEDPITLIL